MLYRMYNKWAQAHGMTVEVLDYQDGDEAGLKSAFMMVKGANAYGLPVSYTHLDVYKRQQLNVLYYVKKRGGKCYDLILAGLHGSGKDHGGPLSGTALPAGTGLLLSLIHI